MNNFVRKSDEFSQTGGVRGVLLRRAIATANYSAYETLLRETLQNSWDQRDSLEISFRVSSRALKGVSLLTLGELLLSPERVERKNIDVDDLVLAAGEKSFLKTLKSEELDVLFIEDFQTKGLSGPTVGTTARGNFANFFYSVGRDDSDSVSGGAFGVGRAVLFNASVLGTAILYSAFEDSDGKMQHRLMGMALGNSKEFEDFHLTGRHWWGLTKANGDFAPVEGENAREIAERIGFSTRNKSNMGTSALIVGLVPFEGSATGKSSRDSTINALINASLKYAWPHMIEGTIDFAFFCDEEQVLIPDVQSEKTLRGFVDAYSKINQSDTKNRTEIIFERTQSLTEPLGTLTYSQDNLVAVKAGKDLDIPHNSVALLREPNFVVKYMSVNEVNPANAIRGVFKATAEADMKYFRKAEPIAHDDWLVNKLGTEKSNLSGKNPIRQTYRKIEEVFKKLRAGSATGGSPATSVIQAFESLLLGVGYFGGPDDGPGNPDGPSTPGGGGKGSKLIPLRYSGLRKSNSEEGLLRIEMDFEVPVGFESFTVRQLLPEIHEVHEDGHTAKNIASEFKLDYALNGAAQNSNQFAFMSGETISLTLYIPQGIKFDIDLKVKKD